MTRDGTGRRGTSEPPAGAADALASSEHRETARVRKGASAPAAPAAPASLLRKEQVRAALFRKLEPIRVGRFILLEQLGAGAMGEIYAAYDDQLDRKVALKLVKGGSGHGKGDERLLREAQTLARVSHPNVVQVYEAGTYNGRLFIAMELIRGKTLTSWLQEAEQVPKAVRQREILRQFIAAGRGLEAAHAAGLAHRDFKPDNVLVGDDGRVRVVDFGLARALVDEPAPYEPAPDEPAPDEPAPDEIALSETVTTGGAAGPGLALDGSTIDHQPAAAPAAARRAAAGDPLPKPAPAGAPDAAPSAPKLKAALRLTETGTVMGTPRFMAPEQLRGAVADQRSDQFSFCVALYHALCGVYPFAGDSWQELRSSIESGELRPAPNVQVPALVRGALRRGLSVEPSQRFPGMGELLAALAPKTRRLRVWLAAAAALACVGLGAGVYARSQAEVDPCADAGAAIDAPWSAERQAALQAAFRQSDRPFAGSAWRGVKLRLDDYAGRWRAEATAACRATNVARTQSAQQLDKRMLCLDRGRRQLAALVDELGAGAPAAVERAVEAAEALPALEGCGDARNLLFGLEPPPASVAVLVAAIRDQLARALALELLGRAEEALAAARAAGAAARGLGYPPAHAEALVQAASALAARGTAEARDEAERLYFEALDIAEAERHDELAARIWNQLVMMAVLSGKEQAIAWWRRNEASVRRLGDSAYGQARVHYMRGEIHYRESKYRQAADEQRRAIAAIERAPAHRIELSRYYDALARSLDELDEREEALRLYDRALAIAAEAFGAGHPTLITLQSNYGRALVLRGQLDRAGNVLEGALASMSARDRESHLQAAVIRSYLSMRDYREGRLDQAAEHARASLEIHRRSRSPDPDVADALKKLANVEFKRRRFDRALALYQDVLALRRRHLGGDHYHVGVTEGDVAETLVELGRHDDALPHLAEAERIFARGASRENRAWILTLRGQALAARRQLGAAIPVLERALGLFEPDEADPTNQVQAIWTLARALHELGRDPGRVRALAERAHAIYAAQGAAGAHKRDEAARFLDQLRTRPAAPAR